MSDNNKLTIIAMSDLHLSFDYSFDRFTFDIPDDTDLIILAGDIVEGDNIFELEHVLEMTKGVPTILTPGNHELYGSDRASIVTRYREFFRGTNVQFLLNESVVINGYRFVVTDLWTDFELNGNKEKDMSIAASSLSDFRHIRIEDSGHYRALLPTDTVQWHKESREFIESELRQSAEPCILVTHHGISRHCNNLHVSRGSLDSAFASDLEPLLNSLERPPLVVIYGHTHEARSQYLPCGSLLYTNQRGYNGHEEIEGFNPTRQVLLNYNKVEGIIEL